jgi:hypothetical protein
VQLVHAVRAEEQHPLAAQAARHECDEGAGRRIGPVQVLEREQHGRLGAEAVEQREDGLEEAGLRRALVAGGRHRRSIGQAGKQPRQLGPCAGVERVEHGVALTHERAQRGDERRVRQLALAQLDRITGQYARTRRAGALVQLAQQPRLADARVTRHEAERRVTGCRVAQCGLQLLELRGAPDDPAARHPPGHA